MDETFCGIRRHCDAGFFCVIGHFVPITQKTLRGDAHLAVR